MNIKDAKEQIKNAIIAYFSKDEYGEYQISIEDQRPVFLMGPPGVGKTAIMKQIASELGVGLVSYSMTHHTRQSALGLPFIQTKNYGGKEYSVSEYTMSEIIASVYDLMEETGLKEGILFLDEINCVSETLAPSMLQFLQYKIFGRHQVPDGWIVVTAGNPPEYNNSVREFDTVTWDRLKRINVEPDYHIWKEYALQKGAHASVTTYLDIKTTDFYKVETTVEGKVIVTARAWMNLSDMIRLYESNDLVVEEKMISQYLQDKKVAKSFANYYDLFNKYKSDYQVDDILAGNVNSNIKERAKAAKFDERLSLLGLLLDRVSTDLKQVYYLEQELGELTSIFKNIKTELTGSKSSAEELINNEIKEKNKEIESGKKANTLSDDQRKIKYSIIGSLEKTNKELNLSESDDGVKQYEIIKKFFNERKKDLKKLVEKTGEKLKNMFVFLEDVFSDGQEMLIVVTELTKGYYSARFISRYGCEKYFEHNKELLFYERQNEIIREIEEMEL